MKQELTELFIALLRELGISDVVPLISRSENSAHGDYTTNVAMVIARKNHDNPITIANKVKDLLESQLASTQGLGGGLTIHQKGQTVSVSGHEKENKNILQDIEKIEVVPPGFINISFSEAKLSTHTSGLLKLEESASIRQKQTDAPVMVEFAHPNTHKAFHIGHLRNITTGECMVRLLEAVGYRVIRANYQGDVGLHIAKCLYGIQKTGTDVAKLEQEPLARRIEAIGNAYVAGSAAYEDGSGKADIERINKQIYAKDPAVYGVYQTTRAWSLEYFDTIYKRVGSHFDRLYFESETYASGKQLVEDGVRQGIFVKDQSAVIFPGEKFHLHNRVFITSDGNPTYEAKDMGLAKLQFSEYHPQRVIHCVGSEQIGYFQVIIEALAQLMPETRGKEQHLVYGWVRLREGKMSSRTGQVILGEWLIDNVKQEIKNILHHNDTNYSESEQNDIAEACAIAAVKYSFLKVGTTQDIAFDIKESVNINGDSGPYLLYAYTRCTSILRKAGDIPHEVAQPVSLQPEERNLARQLLFFDDVVAEAAEKYAPNLICTYLFSLAQVFNQFYAACPILEGPKERRAGRLELVAAVSTVLKRGLSLLGIPTIERM